LKFRRATPRAAIGTAAMFDDTPQRGHRLYFFRPSIRT